MRLDFSGGDKRSVQPVDKQSESIRAFFLEMYHTLTAFLKGSSESTLEVVRLVVYETPVHDEFLALTTDEYGDELSSEAVVGICEPS